MNRLTIFLRVPFDQLSKKEFLKLLEKWISNNTKKLVLNMNAFGVVTYLRHKRYASIVDSADLIYADGWGPVVASWIEAHKLKERINVGDVIDDLLSLLNENEFKLYLLGCEESTVRSTVKSIHSRYPKIRLVGYHNGFVSKSCTKKIVSDLNSKKPHLVLVGMGVPLQEEWIAANWKYLPKSIYMGVGGVFYYITGLKKRAPKIMIDNGLEWLFRLMQEPGRLWKRYTLLNALFLMLVINRMWQRLANKEQHV